MPPTLLVAATERELCGHEGVVCGVGPVDAAALTTRELAARAPVEAVLHVGLAGGEELPLGSRVVGSQSVYDDLSAEWPIVHRLSPDPDLVEAALRALPGAALLPVHTSGTVALRRDTMPGTPLIEAMEGFGVLRAAELAGVPAVEVRAISNELGEKDRGRWDMSGALESLAAALPVLIGAVEDTTAQPV